MLSNLLWAFRLQCTFYVSSPLCRHLLCTVVWSCAKRVAVPLRWETSFIHQAEDREWNYLSSSQSSSFNTSQRFYDLDREIILWGHHQAILSHLLSQGLQRSRPIVCISPFHIINNRTFEIFCFIFKTPNPLFFTRVFSLLSAQWASRQMFAFHQGSSLMNAMPSDLLSRCSRNLHFALFQT